MSGGPRRCDYLSQAIDIVKVFIQALPFMLTVLKQVEVRLMDDHPDCRSAIENPVDGVNLRDLP